MNPQHKLIIDYAKTKGILTCDDWKAFVSSLPAAYSTRVAHPKDIFELVHHTAGRVEQFFCITLNGAHEAIKVHMISKGLVNRTVVHPREVFNPAIEDMACAIIVAHNHPSGHLEPSLEDREITDRLKQASEIVGIQLLDHIVFSKDSWLSFVERGLLTPSIPL